MENSLIYFCLPYQKVYLADIQPQQIIYPEQLKLSLNLSACLDTLKYRGTLSYLGKDYENITVPCIPAKQNSLNYNTHQEEKKECYFIKVPYQTPLYGYASGKRSAIVIKDNKFLRLKGCGNLLEGFVIENNQLRGSHYFHTAKRQLFMTEYINKVLKKSLNITSGNKSLYAFQYGKSIQELKLNNNLPLLPKFCCVYQTLGDRRAGTHLISALQIFFLNLCQLTSIDWKGLFEKKQRIDEHGPIQLLINFQLFLEPGENFLQKYDAQTSMDKKYIDLVSENIKINNRKDYSQTLAILAAKFIKHQDSCFIQKMSKLTNLSELIMAVCFRVGWEMGRIKRIFCEQKINWGFFNDHGSLWHCNAHLNNFLLTKPSENQFLYPIDFDLAFLKTQFIDIQLQSPLYGLPNDDKFEQSLLSEYNAMQMSLSGIQIMNFKYSIDQKMNQQNEETLKLARIGFRDTLIRSFRAGMKNQKEVFEHQELIWKKYLDSIQDLVYCCLSLSSDFQT